MENNCYFVSSRGILKSCDFHSQNPKSSWAYDTDYLIQMINSNNMFDNMSIYICTDIIPFFYNEILPKINNTFYLISGDSDARVPNGDIDIYHNLKILEENMCVQILHHSKLIKWFAQNCIFTNETITTTNDKIYNALTNDKICQLPIGLDYHTISNNPDKFWRDTLDGSTPQYQEMILKNIRLNMLPFYNRIHKIYSNIIGTERVKPLDKIPSELIYKSANYITRKCMWQEIVKYAFVFSPHGNGPDCHRHWEILCLGCIPIIKTFGSDQMFEDLPVLIVNDWSDITQTLLDDTINKFKNMHFNYNKLLLKYWVDKFSSPPLF